MVPDSLKLFNSQPLGSAGRLELGFEESLLRGEPPDKDGTHEKLYSSDPGWLSILSFLFVPLLDLSFLD